jgi:hypothetical protein
MYIYLILEKASIPGLFPAPPLKRLYGTLALNLENMTVFCLRGI